jgi:hypothetical protein
MRKSLVLLCVGFILVTFVACANVGETYIKSENGLSTSLEGKNGTVARISKVCTDLSEDAGWWVVPKNENKLTIFVEAENADTILFWITPTGTETWVDRELIGYAKDGGDGWSFTWNFGERSFHDHITVQVLGDDFISLATDTINIITEE